MLFDLTLLAVGSALVLLGSKRAVVQGATLAAGIGLPPFVIGVVLFSIGTDFAEMATSIVAALAGHGDIAAGDTIGAVFTQGTLVLGLMPFAVRVPLAANRTELLTTCALTFLGLALSALLLSDGLIDRVDALFLALAWLSAMHVLARRDRQRFQPAATARAPMARAAVLVLLWLVLVSTGAVAIVAGVSRLAAAWGLSEYVLSFLLASLGTSLPELVVGFVALRRGHTDIALGNLLGSCLVDATLVVGIGPLVRPTVVSADVVLQGIALAAIGTAAVAVVGARGRIGRRAGVLLLTVYAAAYVFFLGPS